MPQNGALIIIKHDTQQRDKCQETCHSGWEKFMQMDFQNPNHLIRRLTKIRSYRVCTTYSRLAFLVGVGTEELAETEEIFLSALTFLNLIALKSTMDNFG